MATSYELIIDKFIKKLKNDDSILNYKNMTEAEIKEMVDAHLISLLERSIDRIYLYGLPDVNLYDKDDVAQTFNFDLIQQEISLLSDLMYLCYYEEDRNKLKAFTTNFKSNEVSVFSPANERKTFLDMVAKIESDSINSISNYLSRNRDTWQLKSIYGGN